ncbi:hypothetical protein FXF51_06145 [Nonomuraea sp. PA05]|uniref:hypothetical protein n=1 Tax=Nonomuraea sp. PA05 TaxID=2604466 RepID=UPI0011D412FB|nr:hypothetical protein [Nonomuraea sp. PA05]TYB69741.1 hypothetical protein FXF51_06145 [Nonomuraea sp. PA05]
MARPTVLVRSRITGHTALVSPDALRHFPDFEPVDAATDAPSTVPAPPSEADTPKPTTTRRAAAKNDEE